MTRVRGGKPEDQDDEIDRWATYVIAHDAWRRTSRLHLRMGCLKARGLSFKQYEFVVDASLPEGEGR